MKVIQEHVILPSGCSLMVRTDENKVLDNLELHSHPEMEFQFTLKGNGIRTIGDISEPFREMEVVLIPSGIPHTWTYENPKSATVKDYSVQFPKELVTDRLSAFPEFAQAVSKLLQMDAAIEIKGEAAVKISSLMMQMTAMSAEEQFIAFLSILLTFSRALEVRRIATGNPDYHQDAKNRRIRDILLYIEKHSDKNIDLESISSHFSMSKPALCNYLKRRCGKSFSFLLNENRINKACILINSFDDSSIEQVAYAVGYNSPSHFCHMFRKFKGCSPRDYRQFRPNTP